MHVHLHWLDVPVRVKYTFVTMVYNCLHGKAPSCLTDCCTPISSETLRHGVVCVLSVVVSYSSLDTISPHYGRRAFSIAGPAVWNCLSDELRNCEQFQTVT